MLIDDLQRRSSVGQFVFTCFVLILSSSEQRVFTLEPPSFKIGDKVILETSLSCGVGMFQNKQDSMTRCASANEGRNVASKSYLQIRDKQRVVLYLNFYILTTWLYKTFYDTKLALHVSYNAFTIFSLPLLEHVSVLISTCSANISPRNRWDKTDCESSKKA